ncbi:MAG: glycosyl hydrolase family 39 [Terriglobales bacterium]
MAKRIQERDWFDCVESRRKMRGYSRCVVLAGVAILYVLSPISTLAETGPQHSEVTVVDDSAPSHPFPHFWEKMFGSGRAILSLRASYRDDLRRVKGITDFEYVRFHAIFHDEVEVYDEDAQGHPTYNFSYVDQIYDGLLASGVRPFVELSFMPQKLAADKGALHSFWYRPNVSPPKDYAKWDDMIRQFIRHLVDRYGIGEVSQWYFEVWNEPNLDFWAGNPKQATYFEMYDHTARAIKSVNARLRVGGPATAQAAWADAFIRHCSENNVPVDFVSSHVYGDDPSQDVFGTAEEVPRDQMVCRAIKNVHDQILASPMPGLPLVWSEFNASYMTQPSVTDAAYMGPWLADTIRQCDGLVQMMSYWTFSDVFEEQGVVKQPFYGGYGLIAEGGIPKPSFAAFELLHKLGEERLALDSTSALATRKKDGTRVVAVWNSGPAGKPGVLRVITLKFKGGPPVTHASILRVDEEHGNAHLAYEKMGSPHDPSQSQIAALRKAAQLPAAEIRSVHNSELTIILPLPGLAVIEVK